MRKFVVFLFFIYSLCSSAWPFLTVDEAAQAIREFEGIPNLRLKYLGLSTEQFDRDGELINYLIFSPVPWPCYVFETDYPDRVYDRSYTVEPFEGRIIDWYDGKLADAEPYPSDVNAMLTPQQIYNLAVNYIRTLLFPDFDASQYEVEISYDIRRYFIYNPNSPQPWPASTEPLPTTEVHFYHYVIDGEGDKILDRRAYFRLLIGACTGNLISFRYRYYPINISLVPDIGFDEAREIALNYAAQLNPPPTYAEVRRAGKGIVFNGDVPPNCISYVWSLDLALYYSGDEVESSYWSFRELNVDAHTGQAWWLYDFLGGEGSQPTEGKIKEYKKTLESSKKIESKQSWKAVVKRGEVSVLFPQLYKNKFYIRSEQAWLFAVFTR
ncbi:MAG: hypothetical protein ACPLSK_05880, partial [bacterium]